MCCGLSYLQPSTNAKKVSLMLYISFFIISRRRGRGFDSRRGSVFFIFLFKILLNLNTNINLADVTVSLREVFNLIDRLDQFQQHYISCRQVPLRQAWDRSFFLSLFLSFFSLISPFETNIHAAIHQIPRFQLGCQYSMTNYKILLLLMQRGHKKYPSS